MEQSVRAVLLNDGRLGVDFDDLSLPSVVAIDPQTKDAVCDRARLPLPVVPGLQPFHCVGGAPPPLECLEAAWGGIFLMAQKQRTGGPGAVSLALRIYSAPTSCVTQWALSLLPLLDDDSK